MLKDLGALVAPTVMAIMFVAVVVSILRSQNNSRRRARGDSDGAAPAQQAARPATDRTSGTSGTSDEVPSSAE